MSNKIKLNCRYRDNNYLVPLLDKEGNKTTTYKLELENPYVRAGYDGTDRYFIDPSGGPMIKVGEVLPEVGKEVISINHVQNTGYVITFK